MSDNAPRHQRHKSPRPLATPRELIVACAGLKSGVNLSRIVRAAACSGVLRIIYCGTGKVDAEIARDGAQTVTVQRHRSLEHCLNKLKDDGYALVGLEQTDASCDLTSFQFPRRCVLVVGHERRGIDDAILQMLDGAVEIPVYGLPYSHNVATATAIALYEYCRQYPEG